MSIPVYEVNATVLIRLQEPGEPVKLDIVLRMSTPTPEIAKRVATKLLGPYCWSIGRVDDLTVK